MIRVVVSDGDILCFGILKPIDVVPDQVETLARDLA